MTAVAACFSACAAPVVVTHPDGTRVVLGASALEKSANEGASVTLPSGLVASYYKANKDQAVVANQIIRTWGTVAGAQIVADGMNAGEAIRVKGDVAKGAQAAGVEKARVAADVSKTAILNPVE